MKRLLLLVFFGSIVLGCDKKQIPTKQTSVSVLKPSYGFHLDALIDEFGKLADSTFNDSKDLKSILNFKVIDQNGNIKPIGMEKALKLYLSNTKDNTPEVYPIFEIKNTSKAILPVFGKGLWDKIWAKVIVDRKTLKVVQIEFDHKGETPGLGANMSKVEFESQFVGSVLSLESSNYALYKRDEQLMSGNSKIDVISGATITSKGAIEMLNKGLLKYKAYLD
ncbi:FMN-binding protein [uncultured Kordia sp.]|uniref:FMN-binding protein n=1 Tax=uncultured Kordia sp. TaxID=507699 RepID=UPI002612F6CC|nr:FMN-binding protein [uncultured Kordia sp.]